MYRWVQFEEDKVAEYGEKYRLLTNTGYKYKFPLTRVNMSEYDVNSCQKIQEMLNKITEWGGNLSVRMPVGTKPVILVGHNECIYKQYQFTGKSWVGDNKARPIIPKDEGSGLMISAFQSREFGFGLWITDEQLKNQ